MMTKCNPIGIKNLKYHEALCEPIHIAPLCGDLKFKLIHYEWSWESGAVSTARRYYYKQLLMANDGTF